MPIGARLPSSARWGPPLARRPCAAACACHSSTEGLACAQHAAAQRIAVGLATASAERAHRPLIGAAAQQRVEANASGTLLGSLRAAAEGARCRQRATSRMTHNIPHRRRQACAIHEARGARDMRLGVRRATWPKAAMACRRRPLYTQERPRRGVGGNGDALVRAWHRRPRPRGPEGRDQPERGSDEYSSTVDAISQTVREAWH